MKNSNPELRGLLGQLTQLAEKHDVAFILNTHFNKNSDAGTATAKIMGSTAYAAAARMVAVFADHPDGIDDPDDRRFVFQCAKNNLAPLGEGLIYEIEPIQVKDRILHQDGSVMDGLLSTSRIKFTGENYDNTADSLVAKRDKGSPRVDACALWLSAFLHKGDRKLTEIRATSDQLGYSVWALYEAKKRLDVIEDETIGIPKFKFWKLP